MSPSKTIRAASVFALFYVGGALVGLCVLPLVALAVRRPVDRIRASQRLVSSGFRLTLRLLRAFRIFDFDPDRADLERPTEPSIIVANHPTTIDVVAVLAVHRDAVVVIKDKIWRDPLLRWLFRWLGHVWGGDGTLEGNLAVVEAVEARLREGFSVVIFPEGTRSPVGDLAPMAKGAFAIAVRTGRDIFPVLIRCDPPVLHREIAWHEFPGEPVRYRLSSLPRVSTDGTSTKRVQAVVESAYRECIRAHTPAAGPGEAARSGDAIGQRT